ADTGRRYPFFSHLQQNRNDGLADCTALSRPMIREPDLINRWQTGDRRKVTCVSDNRCFILIGTGHGVTSAHLRKPD
ncbi:MAG: hypothetical protein ABF303_19765, partial [Desulfobacterales bacterium]